MKLRNTCHLVLLRPCSVGRNGIFKWKQFIKTQRCALPRTFCAFIFIKPLCSLNCAGPCVYSSLHNRLDVAQIHFLLHFLAQWHIFDGCFLDSWGFVRFFRLSIQLSRYLYFLLHLTFFASKFFTFGDISTTQGFTCWCHIFYLRFFFCYPALSLLLFANVILGYNFFALCHFGLIYINVSLCTLGAQVWYLHFLLGSLRFSETLSAHQHELAWCRCMTGVCFVGECVRSENEYPCRFFSRRRRAARKIGFETIQWEVV